ncbi:hypothetical protein RRSWK_02722 [Rhodopirellula sp. SWK7]|nr:hypothetical protein RRSWK_02722 [Rhodopirellula sp. SWK7]
MESVFVGERVTRICVCFDPQWRLTDSDGCSLSRVSHQSMSGSKADPDRV